MGTNDTTSLEFSNDFEAPRLTPAFRPEPWQQWAIVALYALAMAWVEAAVVLYLRNLTRGIGPYQPNAFPQAEVVAGAELVREAARIEQLTACSVQ